MIIVVRPNATEAQIQHILDRVQELGFKSHYSRGEHRTVIGVIGDDRLPQTETLAAIDGVEQVVRILKPFKLAGRELRPDDTIVRVGPVKIGGGSVALIAGPCAVEDLEGLHRIAARVRAAGANMLRGGAFKPRTSPYSFQGLGMDGLRMLRQIGDEFAMPVVTEVMNVRQIGIVCEFADMLQIGARNMQNFDLLREVGQAKKPVLLKRGMSATVKDLLMSAEYVLASGNPDVVLCERGVRSFEDSTRNTLDLSAVPNVKSQSHLPIIVDPSHATGRADLVPPMARAAIAAGADGVIVEVHDCPERALSDGAQALLPDGFDQLMKDLRRIMPAVGKEAG
jgi:3-deoxy-7-phosphoheptulonate synthase